MDSLAWWQLRKCASFVVIECLSWFLAKLAFILDATLQQGKNPSRPMRVTSAWNSPASVASLLVRNRWSPSLCWNASWECLIDSEAWQLQLHLKCIFMPLKEWLRPGVRLAKRKTCVRVRVHIRRVYLIHKSLKILQCIYSHMFSKKSCFISFLLSSSCVTSWGF